MRQRFSFAIGLFSVLATAASLVACEDGPSQVFSAAPANAGNLWNNGNPDASVAQGTANFDAAFGTTTALENCTTDKQRLVWANMLQQPIVLPLQFAGLNLAGATPAEQAKFAGITLQEAEAINCTGVSGGPGTIFWGNNGEVEFDYSTSNYRVSDVVLSLGYTGKMTMHQRPTSRFGQHTYVFELGQPIFRDGDIYEINWSDITHHDLNEIFNAIMATFGAGLVPLTTADPDENDCYGDGSCIIVQPSQAPGNGGNCLMAFLPIEGFLFQTDCTTNVQPTISIPITFQQQYYLSEPYSYLASYQSISAQGPVSVSRWNNQLGDPQNCFIQTGMDWATYTAQCIDWAPQGFTINSIIDDAGLTIKQVNEAKSVAAATHDSETIDFNIVGVNMNWADEAVIADPTAIVQDGQLPSVTDAVQDRSIQWGTDIYDNGLPFNDVDQVSGVFTGTGSSYIYREWMRLLQNDINATLAAAFPAKAPLYTHQIGDAACFVDPVSANAAGCTGLEGIALQGKADPSDSCGLTGICANYNAGSYFSQTFGGGGYGVSVLHSGFIYAIFCQDPSAVAQGADPLNGNCNYNTAWVGALAQVQAVAGLGNGNNIPAELADRRYYFKWYGIAEAKYLKAYGVNPLATHADVEAQQIDLESMFFDVNGPFDFFEYIERSFMQNQAILYGSKGPVPMGTTGAVNVPAYVNRAPMDFDLGVQTLGGEQQFTSWYKFMYRQESAMFAAMLANKTTTSPVSGVAPNQTVSGGVPVTTTAYVPTAGTACTAATETAKCNTYQGSPVLNAYCNIQDATTGAGICTPLPASQNNVNITNLAGNALLQTNYASYECATQWPTVTINVPAPGSPITGAWNDVCGQACPNLQGVYPNCPVPPLAPPVPNAQSCAPGAPSTCGGAAGVCCPIGGVPSGCNPYTQLCQTIALDLNGANPTIGLGGQNPRLAPYPAVWGQGAACNDAANTCNAATGKCALSATIDCSQDADCIATLNPTGRTTAYTTCGGASIPVPSGVGSVFAVGHKPKGAARLSYVSTNANQLTALVSVPNLLTPYNAIQLPGQAAALAPIQVTVPWSPSYDGVGFDIPVDATHSKNVQTQQLGFDGILETYLMDVVPWTDPLTNVPDGTLTVDAIEGDDYLGEDFLCQDVGAYPVPGTGDLLGAHMYDSAASLLNWITNHPGSETNCQIIVRYTIFDNYVDVITSLSAGVTLYFSTGTSLGRVSAIQAFDPTLAGAP